MSHAEDAAQAPGNLVGSQVSGITFSYQTIIELFHQADDGSVRVHVDLVILSPFVLRSSDGTIYNLDPATSRSALAPVIDLFGGTIAGVTVDGDDTVEHDVAGNPINARGTLTVDLANGAQLTVPTVADPYVDTWWLDRSAYLTLLLSSSCAKWHLSADEVSDWVSAGWRAL